MKSPVLKCLFGILALSLTLISGVSAQELRLPSFLPDYYGPVFNSKRRPLAFVTQRETNGVSQCLYSIGPREGLSIESIPGDGPACRARFDNILAYLDQMITTNQGVFVKATQTELYAKAVLTNLTQDVFAFILPHSVTIWTHSTMTGTAGQFQAGFQDILTGSAMKKR